MTIVDGKRLSNQQIRLDVDGLRSGVYSDRYFMNVVHILEGLVAEDNHRAVATGDIVVEAQYFNRHAPRALVAGVDVALAMLRHAAGYFENDQFVETWHDLEIEAVDDGVFTHYAGDPRQVQPVLKVRGRYRDFALLETAMLGALSRATRVATNVYRVLEVCNGKPVLFFPARFDLPDVQAIDGYAYAVAVQRYNHDFGLDLEPLASTDAQARWWGGEGGGTVPHALIACFHGDTAEAMVAYAQHVPVENPRIALVDFNNDTVGASLATLNAFWPHYQAALEAGDEEGKRRWTSAWRAC